MPLSDRARAIVFALAPSVVAVAVFAPAIGYDFVNWDDDFYIVNNPVVTGSAGVGSRQFWYSTAIGYPIPVTLVTYIANYAIHGLDPAGYHLTNILIHVLNVLLVGALLVRLGLSRAGAFAGALLFAVHPVVVEPVVWATGRKDLLATFFILASAWAWYRPGARARDVAVSIALFIFSFLSKQSAMFVPLFWLVPGLFGARRRSAVIAFVFWVACGVGFAVLLLTAPPLGWSTDVRAGDVVSRVLGTVGAHFALLFSPGELLPRYILPAPTLTQPFSLLGAAVVLSAALFVTLPKTRRHFATRFVLFAVLAFLPVCGFFQNIRYLADSYLYLPLAGLVGLVGFGVEECVRVASRFSAMPKRVLSTLAVVLLPAALLPWTLAQSEVWRNGETLWSYALSVYPDSPQVCRSYGNALYFKERFVDALNVYERCAKMHARPEVFENNIRVTRERLRFERERAISR